MTGPLEIVPSHRGMQTHPRPVPSCLSLSPACLLPVPLLTLPLPPPPPLSPPPPPRPGASSSSRAGRSYPLPPPRPPPLPLPSPLPPRPAAGPLAFPFILASTPAATEGTAWTRKVSKSFSTDILAHLPTLPRLPIELPGVRSRYQSIRLRTELHLRSNQCSVCGYDSDTHHAEKGGITCIGCKHRATALHL